MGQVLDEIDTYANWGTTLNDSRLAVDGIFFDEVPGLYDWQKFAYLGRARAEVKGQVGLGERVIGEFCFPFW